MSVSVDIMISGGLRKTAVAGQSKLHIDGSEIGSLVHCISASFNYYIRNRLPYSRNVDGLRARNCRRVQFYFWWW